ncbi:tyrosine-type recombinase/integrase [Limnohabitans sp.]
MATKKLTIEQQFERDLRGDSPTSKKPENRKSLPPSRRPKLPTGLSYHPTPQGLKYRIRIRSDKKLKALGLKESLDEIFDDLATAEKRLLDLKYKPNIIREANAQKLIKESADLLKTVTIEALCDEHYTKYYSQLKGAKEHRSRMKVICRTQIPTTDIRISMLSHVRFSQIRPDSSKIPFGMVPVVEFEKYLPAFIEARKATVKNQTVVNDLMFLNTALKNCHNYFRNITPITAPLKSVNFKALKDQVTYTDKRLKPEVRSKIEQILIAQSRKPHYADFFIFLSETGCRLSEALTIQAQNVDLEKSIIFLISKKNEKPRYLPITAKLRTTIQELVKHKNPTDRLFPYSKNTYQTKLKTIKPALKEAGIKFSWHMLRHTFISNSIDTKNVFQLMNELDITNYQHFQERYLNEAEAEKVAMKLAQAKELTPNEVKQVVGHSSLEVTGIYTHERAPTREEQLARENEELRAMVALLFKRHEEHRLSTEAILDKGSKEP